MRLAHLAVLMLLFAAPAAASPDLPASRSSQADRLTSGPGADGQSLGTAAIMRCERGERIAGFRLRRAGGVIASIDAICVRVAARKGEGVWLSRPRLWSAALKDDLAARLAAAATLPQTPPAPEKPVRKKKNKSKAKLIIVDEAGAKKPGRKGKTTQPEIEEPVVPPLVGIGHEGGTAISDLICPSGGFVRAIRTISAGGRGGILTGLQIQCGFGLLPRAEWIGDALPAVRAVQTGKKRKGQKTRAARPATVQTVSCSARSADLYDGFAAEALAGVLVPAGILSLGLDCARGLAKPGWIAGQLWDLSDRVTPFGRGAELRFLRPLWFDGSAIALCPQGQGSKTCAKETADRFCREKLGTASTGHTIGKYVPAAVDIYGGHCGRGKCRQLAAVNCKL